MCVGLDMCPSLGLPGIFLSKILLALTRSIHADIVTLCCATEHGISTKKHLKLTNGLVSGTNHAEVKTEHVGQNAGPSERQIDGRYGVNK